MKKKIQSAKYFYGILVILSILYSCNYNSDDLIDEEIITTPTLPYQAEGFVKRDHDKIGDVNSDGVVDIVVGARSEDDGGVDAGAVYILFMNSDETVQSNQKISMLEGAFTKTLNLGNFFGYGVAGIGDYDADGIPDIAVSFPVPPNNSLYIIHLNADGTVKNIIKNTNII